MRIDRILIAASFFLLVCSRNPNPVAVRSFFPEAQKQNIDADLLAEAYSAAESIQGMKSLLVGRNGVLAAERYFNGQGPDSLHDVRSVTKSVVSILIGIAIDRGFIKSVDQPIGDFLNPIVDNLDPVKSQITLRQLLTMSGGFEWAKFGDWSEYSRWSAAPDQIAYVLNQRLIHAPGQVFNYNDGASHLLSVILSRACGLSTLDFAEKCLFEPLGIPRRPWAVDKQEFNKGCVALQLTARDMIKLGMLFLQNGTFEGRTVVSPEWVRASTHASIRTGLTVPYGSAYGFLWWIDSAHSRDFYYANGYGGQFIFNVPGLNFTAVATCDWRSPSDAQANDHWYRVISLIVDTLLPAVR